MSAILPSERRNIRTRLLVFAMYVLLVVGGLTMVYPFLVMLSGSTKSDVDVDDYDVVPRYWYDDAMLFRKHCEEKCNEQFNTFRANYATTNFSFRTLQPPAPPPADLLAAWRQFRRQPVPRGFYLLGASMSRDGRNVPPNLRAFRKHMRELCGGDVSVLQRTYGLNVPNWLGVTAPFEPLTDRGYQPGDSPFMAAFHRFKEACPVEDRIYLSLDHQFAEHVALLAKYRRDIAVYNRLAQSDLRGFESLTLASECPSAPEPAADWEAFVRENLNRQFIVLEPEARAAFAAFLERKHGTLEALNDLYAVPGQEPYGAFADVGLPTDETPAAAMLTDFADFLKDRELLPVRWLRVDTPETRWRDFLRRRGSDLSQAIVPMPQAEADLAYCRDHAAALRRRFAGRNFAMVFEYVLLYGQGIRNTVVFCGLSILAALLVNPFAAYALSRYNLPAQYKVLLFLIATMAFPPVVTMIPNFLLLKDLGLLNTFAALVLPGMANGYSIFLLKGFFDSLPRELYEAAEIDGANEWHKFWVITMSLSKPILAVVALGAFVAAYSNFMMAFILCQDPRMWTLMVWLFKLQSFASQGVVFASLLVAAVPTLLVFLLCQNLIIRGIVVPTEK